MSKSSKKFHNPADPRTRLVRDLEVSDRLRDSRIRYIKPQKKGGVMGVRITLDDFRSAWARTDSAVVDLRFAR